MFLTRMTHNWTKMITTKMNMTLKKSIINGYVFVEKYHNL